MGHLRRRAHDFAQIELAQYLGAYAGLMIVPFMLGAAEAGTFNLALRIVLAMVLPVATINLLLVPQLVQARRDGDAGSWNAMRRTAGGIMLGYGLLAGAALWLLGPLLLEAAGPEFAAASAALAIMASLFALGIMLGPVGAVLAVLDRER